MRAAVIIIVVLLAATFACDVGLVVSGQRFASHTAVIPPILATVMLGLVFYHYYAQVLAARTAYKHETAVIDSATTVIERALRRGLHLTPPASRPPAAVSRVPTRLELTWGIFTIVLVVMTFVDMIRILRSWHFATNFSLCPCTFAGAFLLKMFTDYIVGFIVSA